jgi:hypothetical protein
MTGHGIWGHIPSICGHMTVYDGICQVGRIPDGRYAHYADAAATRRGKRPPAGGTCPSQSLAGFKASSVRTTTARAGDGASLAVTRAEPHARLIQVTPSPLGVVSGRAPGTCQSSFVPPPGLCHHDAHYAEPAGPARLGVLRQAATGRYVSVFRVLRTITQPEAGLCPLRRARWG